MFNDAPTLFLNWDCAFFFENIFLAFLPETSFVAIDSYLFPVSTKTFFESPTRERNTFISVELFRRKNETNIFTDSDHNIKITSFCSSVSCNCAKNKGRKEKGDMRGVSLSLCLSFSQRIEVIYGK